MTIDLQNRQNLSSPSRIFASILQVRQAPSAIQNVVRKTMKLNIGFIIDPLETLHESMDTSLLMISEANLRGHRAAFCTIDDLTLLNHQARARWTDINYQSGKTPLLECSGNPLQAPLAEFDAVVMRKDPPFDKTYLAATYLLDYANTIVINSPKGLREANEKLFMLRWPHLTPKTFISKNIGEILAFIDSEQGQWVVKPLDLCGGKNVFRIESGDGSTRSALNTVTANGSEYAVVQEFLENVVNGDKRIFLVDGEPLGWMNRLPSKNDFRANIHLGAEPMACELNNRDREIISTLRPVLNELGLAFVCLDIIDGYLTEVNVTSPSGIPEINKVNNKRHESVLIDCIEKTCQGKK
jgi:glutathione synthase